MFWSQIVKYIDIFIWNLKNHVYLLKIDMDTYQRI